MIRKQPPAPALDRIDVALIGLLQNDARRSNKELAAAVGLAPSTCLERVRRLHDAGVITGSSVTVAPRAVGVGLEAMIRIRLRRTRQGALQSVLDVLLAHREVVAVHHLSGLDDLLVQVAVRDADHLRDVALEVVGDHPEVGDVQTSLIFESWRGRPLPVYADD